MIHPRMQPAQMPVMSTFVPIPFEAMAKAGAAQQNLYDQTQEVQGNVTDLLEGAKGLSGVQLTNGYMEAHGQERVDAKVKEILGEVDSLSKGTPNTLGTEYQTKLKRILRNAKNAFSSSGVIGQEKANMEAYQKVRAKLAKNTQWMDDPSTALQVDSMLRAYAETPADTLGSINSDVNISDYVDVGEKMDKIIKGARETYQGGTFAKGPNGWLKYTESYGLSGNRIKRIVQDRIASDPQLNSTINRRAAYLKTRGAEGTVEEIKDRLIDNEAINAINLHAGSKGTSTKWFDMNSKDSNNPNNPNNPNGLRAKVMIQRKSEIPNVDYISIMGQLSKINNTLRLKEEALTKMKGGFRKVVKDNQVVAYMQDFEDGTEVDVSDRVFNAEMDLEVSRNLKERVGAANAAGEAKVGMRKFLKSKLPYYLNPENTYDFGIPYEKTLTYVAAVEAVKAEDPTLEESYEPSFRAASPNFPSPAMGDELGEEYYSEVNAKQEEIRNNPSKYENELLKGLSLMLERHANANPIDEREYVSKVKKYKEYMEKTYTDTSTEAVITPFTKAQLSNNILLNTLAVTAGDIESSINNAYHLHDNEPVTEEEFAEYDAQKAKAIGYILDPNSDNEFRTIYKVPKAEGNGSIWWKGPKLQGIDSFLIGNDSGKDINYKIALQLNSRLHGDAATSRIPTPIEFNSDIAYAEKVYGVAIPKEARPLFDFKVDVLGPNATPDDTGWVIRLPDASSPGGYYQEEAGGQEDAVRKVSIAYQTHLKRLDAYIKNLKK